MTDAPHCPGCHCADTRVVGKREFFNIAIIEDRRCRYCARQFSVRIDKPKDAAATSDDGIVPYRSVRVECPSCHAANPPVIRTDTEGGSTIRTHRCACGHRFRSREQ